MKRSASVDLPWSMWAMMEKLRMWSIVRRRVQTNKGHRQGARAPAIAVLKLNFTSSGLAAHPQAPSRRPVEAVVAELEPSAGRRASTGTCRPTSASSRGGDPRPPPRSRSRARACKRLQGGEHLVAEVAVGARENGETGMSPRPASPASESPSRGSHRPRSFAVQRRASRRTAARRASSAASPTRPSRILTSDVVDLRRAIFASVVDRCSRSRG